MSFLVCSELPLITQQDKACASPQTVRVMNVEHLWRSIGARHALQLSEIRTRITLKSRGWRLLPVATMLLWLMKHTSFRARYPSKKSVMEAPKNTPVGNTDPRVQFENQATQAQRPVRRKLAKRSSRALLILQTARTVMQVVSLAS